MAFRIEDFKSQGLPNGGARPTQFKIMLTPPFATINGSKIEFSCKSASLPSMIVGKVEMGYFGRTMKLVGDRQFDDWVVSIYNDIDFPVKAILEKWSNLMNSLVGNELSDAGFNTTNTPSYKSDATVIQYDQSGKAARAYKFVGLFPTEISDIPLDWGAVNQIEEFRVNFTYDYWIPDRTDVVYDSADDYSGDINNNTNFGV